MIQNPDYIHIVDNSRFVPEALITTCIIVIVVGLWLAWRDTRRR